MATLPELESYLWQKMSDRGIESLYPYARRIMSLESGDSPDAYNGQGMDNSVGLFQINMIGGMGDSRAAAWFGTDRATAMQLLKDPYKNIDIAVDRFMLPNYEASGGDVYGTFKDWSTASQAMRDVGSGLAASTPSYQGTDWGAAEDAAGYGGSPAPIAPTKESSGYYGGAKASEANVEPVIIDGKVYSYKVTFGGSEQTITLPNGNKVTVPGDKGETIYMTPEEYTYFKATGKRYEPKTTSDLTGMANTTLRMYEDLVKRSELTQDDAIRRFNADVTASKEAFDRWYKGNSTRIAQAGAENDAATQERVRWEDLEDATMDRATLRYQYDSLNTTRARDIGNLMENFYPKLQGVNVPFVGKFDLPQFAPSDLYGPDAILKPDIPGIASMPTYNRPSTLSGYEPYGGPDIPTYNVPDISLPTFPDEEIKQHLRW